MTDTELVARIHRALSLHPAPPTLLYEELTPVGLIERLVTETVLYEEGEIREWFLDFGRAIIELPELPPPSAPMPPSLADRVPTLPDLGEWILD